MTVAFFVELHYSCTPGRRRWRQLPLPSSWSCVVAPPQEEEGDGNVAAVAIFLSIVLQCRKTSATAQRCVLRYATLQRSSTRANAVSGAMLQCKKTSVAAQRYVLRYVVLQRNSTRANVFSGDVLQRCISCAA